MPEVITNYDDFLVARLQVRGLTSLFWLVEYSPTELGEEINSVEYKNSAKRYSLLRNECLNYPNDYIQRLNSGVYRIWTVIPQVDYPW